MKIILASTSPYRRALLEKTGIPFRVQSPAVDEIHLSGESIDEYVGRLALTKARAVAAGTDSALVIGADQACLLDGVILGKPGSHATAREQLKRCSGRKLQFRTAIALVNSDSGHHQLQIEPFEVLFRCLSEPEIEAYLLRDKPYDCAGSFKVEGAGICLFRQLKGRDFNSLIGLPLLALMEMLFEEGVNPLLATTD